MTERIERLVHLDDLGIGLDELAALVTTVDGWKQWLVDDGVADLQPDGVGEIVDGEIIKHLRVHRVGERSIGFTWWEHDDPSSVSHVELDVVDLPDGGTALRIREELPAHASAASRLAWEVRVCSLWACCVAAALV